jgi:tellurite resistance protein TerC
MVLHAIHSLGVHVPEVSLEVSLGVIVLTLIVTAVTSLAATRKGGPGQKAQLS